jgi:Na+/H+ antiporter NhaD/arsenite permease-like protein
MTATTVAIFALTYVLIAGRRLRLLPIGRPAGALLGAVLMVATGAISPEQSYDAIDHDTIVLLFATMLLTAYLARAGFFERIGAATVRFCRTPGQLLVAVSLLSAVLSALLVNDTVCVFLTPVVVTVCVRRGLPLAPYLIALATSSNIGSAATIVGNPQNMFIGSQSRIAFADFLMIVGPAAAVGVAINLLLLRLIYGRQLRETSAREDAALPVVRAAPRGEVIRVSVATVAIAIGFFFTPHPGYMVLGGVLILMLADRKAPDDALAKVDWPLLVFFCSLFIVVRALALTGIVSDAWSACAAWTSTTTAAGVAGYSTLLAAGSNVVSNVPMAMLAAPYAVSASDPLLAWTLMAFVTTVAGNLTLIGSVANIIVAERAREAYVPGFWEYLRFGAVSTVAVLAVGVPVVCVMRALVG